MQRNKPDISFIIPVYNGAAVISRMTESIFALAETVSFEVIIVDDGSTDETPEILSSIQKAHDNVRVHTIPNSGQSRARNLGVTDAKGEYLFFADADDRVIGEGIEKMLNAAKSGGYDVVCGTYLRIEKGKDVYRACEGIPDGVFSREKGALFESERSRYTIRQKSWQRILRC